MRLPLDHCCLLASPPLYLVINTSIVWHAALAISALSKSRYFPNRIKDTIKSSDEYAVKQYNQAIKELNCRLDSSTRSWELAILASIVFIAIEVFLGFDYKVQIHLRGAFAILKTQPDIVAYPVLRQNSESASLVTEAWSRTSRSISNLDYLVDALFQLDRQVYSFATLHR